MKPLNFEDLKVGMEFQSAHSKPITKEDVIFFAKKYGNRDHLPSIQGNLVIDICAGLLYDHGHFDGTLFMKARQDTSFLKPVLVGDAVYAREQVILLEDRPNKPYGRVVLRRKIYNQRDQVVIETIQDFRILKKDAQERA